MNKKYFSASILALFTITAFSQFHTLNIPQKSPKVLESQKIGVTDITIDYSSPAVKDRDVWNNQQIIPQNGNPIPWRAGANMNTTITFSTNVNIEGEMLKAGTYGFHIIPNEETYTLLFAHNHNQWGSYYLDIEKDISLRLEVTAVDCNFSEQLNFEFLNRSENSVVIGLEWGDKRIPFTVSVDLNKTVVESFRNELRGVNTYHWQAWDDAAKWCLVHDTNLEEALEWSNRSINGGYYGFAANKNVTNTGTNIKLLKKANKTDKVAEAIAESKKMLVNEHDANELSIFFLRTEFYEDALDYSKNKLKVFPDSWSLLLNKGIANYFLNNAKAAIKDVKEVIKLAPEQFNNRLNEIINEFETGTYKLR